MVGERVEEARTPVQQPPRPARRQRRLEQDVAAIVASLPPPPALGRPVLIALSGLPGSGKTYLGVRLAARLGAAILHSDRARKLLVPTPKYTPDEHNRVFRAMHEAVRRLLATGVPVVFDATNLKSGDRQPLRKIAREAGVTFLLVRLWASPELTAQRLDQRQRQRDEHDFSDADWTVYEMLAAREAGEHQADIVVTPDMPTDAAIDRILSLLP